MAFLKVHLRSSAGEVELSTDGREAPFRLLDGARGFGLPTRAIESSAIASGNGSVLRSQRFDESDMMLPISIRGVDASDVAAQSRELERVLMPASSEPIEIVVEAPELSTTRRRFIYYAGGLEGAIGSQDSHWVWRHAQVAFRALDPLWYGRERVMPQRIDLGRKPFITSTLEPMTGAVYRRTRAPTEMDPGSAGDVWLVGEDGRIDETVLATNLNTNPSFEDPSRGRGYGGHTSVTIFTFSTAGFQVYGERGARASIGTGADTLTWVRGPQFPVTPGQWVGMGLDLQARTNSPWTRLRVIFYNESGSIVGTSPYLTPYIDVSAGFTRIAGAAQVPSGAVTAYSYFYMSGSAEGSAPAYQTEVSFDGWSIVETGDQTSAEATARDYFDGDTTSGTSIDDPHYRWTGDPQDSPSEKYLPAGPTSFKATARYKHDGTSWIDVGLERRVPFFLIMLASSVIRGAYQLEISGDAAAWPIWEVTGPGTDLLIENTETGERIFIEGEFGEKVTIDTRPTIADIYSDEEDEGQLWERVSDDYTLFPLNPGLNSIRITMVGSRPHSVVTLRYSETWMAGW